MLKKKSHILRSLIVLLTMVVLIVVLSATVLSATRTASVSGNWNATATWGGSAVPTAADAVIINNGITVTVNAAATCLSVTNNGILTFTTFGMTVAGPWVNNGTVNVGTATVTFNGTTAINAGTGTANFYTIVTATTTTTLTINTPVTVTGNLTLNGTAVSNTITIAGSNSITVAGTTSIPRPTTSGVSTIAVGAGTLSTATLTLGGTSNGRNTVVTVSTGTVNVTGTFTGSGTANPSGSVFTFTGAGALNVGGATTTAIPQSTTLWTFTPGTGTVNFNGAAQTIGANTFNNLTLSGSGVKTTTGATVNGILDMAGTATASAAPTYGASATLQYDQTVTTGPEWITPFVSTGGVIINSGTVTLGAAKVLGNNTSVPLNIKSGATLTPGANLLTFDGDFINAGTLTSGSGGVTIAGTVATQNIAGFTTTGTVTMTKTGGIATLQGNVNGGALTINGTGGTLNLGAGLTHTFTGVVTLTAGTLNGGSSTLNENATSTTAWNGTGTNFTAGTGTVVFGGVAQTLATASTFYNLTFTGAGTATKTLTGVPTINNILSMEGTATASAAPTYGVNATLQYNTATARTAGLEWIVNFAGTGGIIITNTGTITINSAEAINAPLTINSGATLSTNNFDLTLGGNFINNGGTFTVGSSNMTISGTGTQSIAGFTTTGTVTMTKTGGTATLQGAMSSGALTLNGNGGIFNLGTGFTHSVPSITFTNGTLSLGSSTINVAGTIALNTGTLDLGSGVLNLTTDVSGAGTFTGNTGIINIGGNWTHTGTFTATTCTINYNGTSTDQIVRGGITYYNLQISNGSSKLLQVGNATVSNILTLNSGVLKINDFNLLLTNTAVGAIAGAPYSVSNMIQTDGVGYVQKTGGTYTAPGLNIVYPVGTSGYYNPLDLSSGFTATSGTGNLQIRATVANQGANALSKYWTLAVTGYAGITTNLRFTYDNAEVRGSKSQYDAWYNGGSWVSAPGTHTSLGVDPFGTNVSGLTAAAISGKWTAGSSSPATSISYYSYQSGDWAAATSWTTDPSGTLWINSGVPTTSDNVTILNGRTISINANTKTVTTLTVNQGGILDLQSYTGHNFGTVTGQGKIMLSSNTFPGGTYTNFVASNGGTIEYYNLNGVSLGTTQLTYNNLIISNYSTNAITSYLYAGTNPTTYTINGNFNLKNYSTGTNTFYFGNSTVSDNLINMTVSGNFSVDANCNIRVNNFATSHAIPNPTTAINTAAYPIHTLTLYGNLTNNGSVRFTGLPSPVKNSNYILTTTADSTGTNYGDVQVYFKGAANNAVVCNGVTDFFRMIVEKGTDNTYVLEVSSSNINNFGLYAPNNQGNSVFDGNPEGYGYGAYYKALFIHYGTLKLDENINVPSLTEGGQDFQLIPTAGLWINGANVSTTVSGVNGTGYQAATLYGSLRVSAGSFSTGDAAGIVLGILGTPVVQIEGTGTLDVSQLWASSGTNLMSYIQTGGTANFRMLGENHPGSMLGLSGTNSVFIMSGGVMNFTNYAFGDATTDYQLLDIESQVGNYQVTGGTINFNLPSSSTSYTATSTVPFYNLNILRRIVGGTGNTVTIQWNTANSTLNVLNDFTIGSNTVLNLSTNTDNLAVGHDFTIASGGTYTPGTAAANTTTFNGTGAQAFNNIGTITGAALNNLTITNSSITSIVSSNLTVNGALTINTNATLNDSGKTITVLGNIVNSGTHATYQTTGGIMLSGTAVQTLSGSGTGVFKNLTLSKTGGSVTMTASMAITGNLNLAGTTAGVWNILNIGTNNLVLGANAMVYSDLVGGTTFNNNRMILTSGLSSDRGVSKTYSNTTVFNFPFGFYNTSNTTYYYMPQSIQFSIAPTVYGTVTTRPVDARHPLLQSTNSLTCYWKTTSNGFAGIPAGSVVNNYYYDYAASNYFVSGTETNYIPGVLNNSIWHTASNGVTSGTNLVTYTVDNADGDFTAGEAAAFGSIPTLYSIVSGNWNSVNTWSTTRGGSAGTTTPTTATLVYVCTGTTVTTTLAASSSSLTIEPGATLDLGSVVAHNFGTILNNASTGSGKLRIASSGYFPIGDWGSFLGTSGGTVEYYQTAAGTLTLPTTYTLPGGGTATITGYYNLVTSPYNASNIILPNANLSVYNNFTIGYSVGGGTTNCITQMNAGATSTTLEVHGTIVVNQYGILQYMNTAAQNLIADSDIVIAVGGALQVRNGGTSVANTLTVYGNIINNGTFDLDPNYPTNDTYYSSLLVTGSSSKSLTSTATPIRTRLYNIGISKGTSRDSILNVTIDPTGFQMGGGGLNLQNGTFRLTTTVTMNLSTGAFTIPSSSCLSANGGTLNIATGTTAADLTLNGRLEVLAGSVNVGPAITSTSNSFNIVYASAGIPEIIVSGGGLNVYSQIRRGTSNNSGSLNYTQNGGIVTIGGKSASTSRAVFEVLNTGSKFVMSNGTLIIANHINTAVPFDLDLEPDISNVTGGTIQFGLSTSATTSSNFLFQSSCPLGSLTLEATTNSSAIQQIYDLILIGSLTIGGSSSYYNTNGLDVTIGGNLTNNNTTAASNGITVGGFQTQVLTQTTTFNGSSDQTLTGTSTPNRTNFANVEVLTAQGHSLFLSNATPSNITINGDLTLTSGTLNDGGNSIYLLNDVDNNAVHVSTNTTTGGMIFTGTVNQGITGSGSGVFGNIEINNGGNGVNMTDNTAINGQLKFTNGDLYIDDYALTLGQNASIVGTFNVSNSILLNGVLSDRGVTKIFATGASSFAFPISANGKYTPCSYNFASNSNSSGATIKVVPVDSRQPSVPDTTSNYLAYYWSVSTTGFSAAYNVTHTYTYIPTDVEGTAQYIQRYDNSTGQWSTVTGTISSPTFTFASTTLLDGSYTIGNQFASLATITSIKSGNWSDATLWNTGTVPHGNPVVIRSADSVALNTNGANAASVVINGVLDALNSTFHNLGQVSGSGKIRLSSTSSGMFAFPGGTYDAFLTNAASTVEFYGTINGTLPLDPGNVTKPYQNVIFSGTGIKYISGVDMKVNGNLILSDGSKLDNTQYNKDVYLLGNWIDNNTSASGFNGGTGTVRFSGTTVQNIIMASNSMTEAFYNFAINNAVGLILQTGKVAINNQLILTTGNINTNSTNTLTIMNTSNSGVVVGGGVSSFVNGPLSKEINNGSNFQFPVGDAVSSGRNRIGYVSVTSTATTGTQIWTAQFFDKNPSIDGYDITKITSPLSSVVQNEYWNVIGPTGGTANVVLNWDSSTGMNSSVAKRALSRVAEWNTPTSSSWNSVSTVVTDNGQYSGTVATSTLVGLDNHIFTIGAMSASLITAIQSGLWNNSSTWGGGGVPSLNDTVRIGNTITITLNTDAAIAKLMIDTGGTFNNGSNTLTLSGNLVFNGTWTGSGGKISMTTSPDTIFGTGTMAAGSTLEIAGIKVIAASASPKLATVSILANDTIYNNGIVTINNLSGAVFVNNPGSIFYFTGADLNSVTVLATSSTNIIEYSGTVSQIVKPIIYSGLNFSNTGLKTLSASTTTNGTVNVSSNAHFVITGDVSTILTIHGDFNNDGTVDAGGQIVNQ